MALLTHTGGLFAELGPALDFPCSSKVNGSRHNLMREPRNQIMAVEDVVCV